MKRSEFYTLGRTGLRASRLALGAMTFGTDWGWGTDKEGARQLFNHYVEAGGNLVDTADLYTSGVSEEWVGEFIRERQLRDRIVLATKFSYSAQPDNPNAGGNGRKNILRAVEGSLRRLDTDYIDLYLLHTWDMLTPVDEVMRIFDDLVRSPEGGLSIDWWRRRECSRIARPSLRSGPPAYGRRRRIAMRDARRTRNTGSLPHRLHKSKSHPLGGLCFYWWRRRESNPRPQVLCRRFYMLSRVFNLAGCYPTGREDRQRFRYFFNVSAPDELPSRSCEI